MANAYTLNQTPVGYGAAMSLLVEMLISAGWVYKQSGDGLVGYSSTGKVFASTGSGAGGWGNTKAWARVQDPGGVREYIFQAGGIGTVRIKYSAAAKFSGGSATVTPSATDEKYIRGAGTDAAPTYSATAWFTSSAGTIKYQGAALGTAPYGFWFCGATTPAGAIQCGILHDPVTSVAEDTDPLVIHIGNTAAFTISTTGIGQNGSTAATWVNTNGASAEGCWAFLDVGRTSYLPVQPAQYFVGTGTSGINVGTQAFGLNPFNGKHEALPVPYVRTQVSGLTTATPGLKGWSTMMRWSTIARTNFVDTLDSLKWICVGGSLFLPWDGTTTPTN